MSTLALGLLALLAVREIGAQSRRDRLFVILMILAVSGTGITIGNGQLGLHCVITSYSIHYTKLYDGKDDVAVKRIINIPKRGIGATSIAKVQEYADARNISFYDACKEADQIMTLGKSAEKLKPFRITSYNVCYTKLLRNIRFLFFDKN